MANTNRLVPSSPIPLPQLEAPLPIYALLKQLWYDLTLKVVINFMIDTPNQCRIIKLPIDGEPVDPLDSVVGV